MTFVFLSFFVFCIVFFALFVFILCHAYPTLPVSLCYQFLTVPSVFSNVDLSNIMDNSDGFKIVNIS